MDDDLKFHQTWHLHQLPSFYQQFLFIFYSVYKNKPRGVTIKDLIKFIKKNYYLDGDLLPQMITVIRQAVDQGVIEERCDKYYLVGPIASVQETAANSPERRSHLKNINGVFNYNLTQRKSRSKSKAKTGDNKVSFGLQSGQNSKDKIDRPTIYNSTRRSGSREKTSSVGLALQEKNLADALQLNPSTSNKPSTPSRFVPNITVLSRIKQYFETTVCKCPQRTSSKSKSKTKSSPSLSKPSSNTNSSLTMKTASQHSKCSKNSKDISLRSRHDNSSDEYLSFHSKSDKLKHWQCNSQNSKSPKIGGSSQRISLQATRSKTPTECTIVSGKKNSNARSSTSKYSDPNHKSFLSFIPTISTFQHFLGCKECNAAEKPKILPSTRTLRSRTDTSRHKFNRCGLTPPKKACLKRNTPKRLNVRFRTMHRDKCSGQFCSLRQKCSTCRACKVRIPRPISANSSRPLTRNTYTATRTSMQTRSSARGRCLSAYSSKTGSLGRSSISVSPIKSISPIKAKTSKKKKRKSTASSIKMCSKKRQKLRSRDSLADSYWGDFCCV